LGFDFTRDDWDQVAREYHAVYARTSVAAPLRAGVRAALETLAAQGFGLSVLSACESDLLRRMMAERGILGCFAHVYGLDDLFAYSKVDLGHAMLASTGLAPETALLVGDTVHDFEVAQALGCRCLLMEGGHQSAAKLRACACPLVPDLPGVLAGLGAAGGPSG
jgi:phosphoglycolate phosphatase